VLPALALALACALPVRAAAKDAPRSPLLVYTGDVGLEVSEAETATGAIESAVKALGGRVASRSDRQVVVEIPSARRQELVSRLARLGKITRQRIAAEDASIALADAESAARAAREARQRMQDVRPRAQNVGEGLAAEREIETAEKAVAAAGARATELRRRGEVARISIQLAAPSAETIAAPVLPFPWLGGLGLSSLYHPEETEHYEESLELRAFLDGAMYIETSYAPDPEPLDDTSVLVAGGMSMRVLGEANPIGLFGGFDLALGGGGGFLYELQSLFGVGVPIGSRIAVGLASGPGIDGVTGGVVDFGVPIPIELYLSLDVATWLGVTLWARDGWVLASDERDDGSETALFGDEASAGITLAFAPLAERTSMGAYSDERLGLEIGFGARELLGTRLYELRLGWGGWDADFSTSH
jgi:hypothetical protein